MKRVYFILSFLACTVSTFAQSDEINISASFAQSIALTVYDGANITFEFNSLEKYQSGLSGSSKFQVSSSTSFNVDMSFTPFVNADGDEIDLKNLEFSLAATGSTNTPAGQGDKWNFGTGNITSRNLPGVQRNYATLEPRTVVLAGPSGNAGSTDENDFIVYFDFGVPTWLNSAEIGLPTLLEQNIAPGTYTCTVTLEAIPVIL